MSPRQSVSGPHFTRARARSVERRIQRELDAYWDNMDQPNQPWPKDIPGWARGAKVEKVGFFQYQVIVTPNKGH